MEMQKYVLLICDDEHIISNRLKRVFEQNDRLSVHNTYNAYEALDYVRSHAVDIALLDISMPKIDGLQLMRLIREICPEMLVVFLTGFKNFEHVYEAFQEERVRYILKSDGEDSIKQTIVSCVDWLDKERNTKQWLKKTTALLDKHNGKSELSYENPTIEDILERFETLLWELMQTEQTQDTEPCVLPGLNNSSREFILTVNKYIEENLDGDLSLSTLAGHVFLNRSYFSRLYKQITGINLSSYINEKRLEKAKRLLTSTDNMVYDIALQIGFDSQSYFTVFFKKAVGMSPQAYRNESRKG